MNGAVEIFTAALALHAADLVSGLSANIAIHCNSYSTRRDVQLSYVAYGTQSIFDGFVRGIRFSSHWVFEDLLIAVRNF